MCLSVENLSFSYKTANVLKGVSFSAAEGNLLCVLGKNGAGKSTLFKCILGLLNGYNGTIKIHGTVAHLLSVQELSQKIAYIPQNHSIVFSYSVVDMVMMGITPHLRHFESPGGNHKKAAIEALELLNILHLKDKSFNQLSGGEQQLVLIARSVAQQTKILIMDEPCSNLDYGNQIKVMRTIKELAKKGYLIIQSTHNPEHAFLFADEVLVLMEGRVKDKGKADAILTEELLEAIYSIHVNLHNIQDRNLKVCIPDVKEMQG